MSSEKVPVVRARDVMRKGVVKVDGMATAREIREIMRRENLTELVVEKRHGDDAWGLVAVQDLVRGVLLTGRNSAEVNVYEIMSKPAITVPAEMDIRYVALLLHRAGIRRAPVEEGGKLVGMVSLAGLILNNDLF